MALLQVFVLGVPNMQAPQPACMRPKLDHFFVKEIVARLQAPTLSAAGLARWPPVMHLCTAISAPSACRAHSMSSHEHEVHLLNAVCTGICNATMPFGTAIPAPSAHLAHSSLSHEHEVRLLNAGCTRICHLSMKRAVSKLVALGSVARGQTAPPNNLRLASSTNMSA